MMNSPFFEQSIAKHLMFLRMWAFRFLIVGALCLVASKRNALGDVRPDAWTDRLLTGRATLRAETRTQLIFFSEFYNSSILLLDARGKIVSRVANRYPQSGIALDSSGNLLVSGNGRENAIQIFKPPAYTSFTQLSLPLGDLAIGVAVYPRTDLLAVSAIHVRGESEVRFYRKGETQACRVVKSEPSNFVFRGDAAFDRNGTLFTHVASQSKDEMAVVGGGCGSGSVKIATFSKPFADFSAFEFDRNDSLVIQTAVVYKNYPLLTFAHSETGDFLKLISTKYLPAYRGESVGFNCLLSDGLGMLGSTNNNTLLHYDYPRFGKPHWVLKGLPAGAHEAVFPPLSP